MKQNEIEKINSENHCLKISRTQEIEFLLSQNTLLENRIKHLSPSK
jgi:hypothetical protein